MLNPMESLVNVLESHRGRDKVIRTVCYGSQLAGGVLSEKTESAAHLGKSLLLFSAQLSQCRTVLRLFDDLSMLAYSQNYGLGAREKDVSLRWMSVLNNLADQLYYPCEHIAWAAETELIKVQPDKWWLFSTTLWGVSLLLGILRSIRLLILLRRKLRKCAGNNFNIDGNVSSQSQLRRQMRLEVLSVLSSMADLSNAIHWMPPGFLWGGYFPNWLIGLMGTISSLIGLIQLNASSSDQSSSCDVAVLLEAAQTPNPDLKDPDSYNLIQPPPLDWRSDSSDAVSVEEHDCSNSPPSSDPVDMADEDLSESVPQLDVNDTAHTPELVVDYSEPAVDASIKLKEEDEEVQDNGIHRPSDQDHTRIHALLNQLQLIGQTPYSEASTSPPPEPSHYGEPSQPLGPPLNAAVRGLQSVPTEIKGLLFSESHQIDVRGILETEIGTSPEPAAQASFLPQREEADTEDPVSYYKEDDKRFWDHYGNGQPSTRDSYGSSPDDEYPEPLWMKFGAEPPEDVAAAEEKSEEDETAYKDVPGPCDPEDLLDGVIFGAKYLGSTQLKSEKTPSTNARMAQAQAAMDMIKAPEGESQPMTEVELFISTQRIKVLSSDTQEAMMDHSLQMISYIADIGSTLVLMARRKAVRGDEPESEPAANARPLKKCCMICHVFSSEDAQIIAQAIGQAFGVAYKHFLKSNGIKASELRPGEYSDYLGTQELYNGDLVHFSDSQNSREVTISKAPGEIVGLAVVESGWGSILPTVVVANLLHGGPAERCGELSIGDRIMSVNGTSLVGLPIATCQSIIRDLKNLTIVKLSIVHCPPVTMAIIKRPDPKFQLGFSVEDGIICSLMRGGIAERGGIRVGHHIIEINGQSVVATPHEKIIHILTNAVGEIHLKTMPASTYRLLTGQEQPVFL
ncbi:amyloid-beta A4 precursor protein-binding family A member 3 [Aplochiton taeniatus]